MRAHHPLVLIRGGGDLATGVAARLKCCGFDVVVVEIEKPLAVRRLVSLAEAVYAGEVEIEELCGRRIESAKVVEPALEDGVVPVLVDPTAESRHHLKPVVIVDGRMRKVAPEIGMEAAPLVIGLGPGFTAGHDCHAVVETNRGHYMGRVYWEGSAEPDTTRPEKVANYDLDRVLRSPTTGLFEGKMRLGSIVRKGEVIAVVDGIALQAPFDGALRGLLHSGIEVEEGMKVGDSDPRGEPSYCYQISDKSLAVGGGVLEAILSRREIRKLLGS
ncbi:MAG TPA: EF2563 family selenium-dependent molybdenum hydroxylase system protein [Anaerolineae bacterium]|nr:EF2563 family selenium-dependent molybdenum hydroxylase system protein [Anaerolineae bacterium]